jgi:lipopolysaccharide/colanic/teichoic acid biosynthesis glycosyltransferase
MQRLATPVPNAGWVPDWVPTVQTRRPYKHEYRSSHASMFPLKLSKSELEARGADCSAGMSRLRRGIDVSVSLIMLLALAPLFAAVCFAILFEDGRPLLFRQTRVGKNGRFFQILKFRTMRDAACGAMITAAGDTRVTRCGAFLRKYKLDEIPQFANVLRGDMSLIGPRPEVPQYVEAQDRLWQSVLRVRPGITDLATLAFRDEEHLLLSAPDPEAFYRTSILPRKLRLNLRYQRSRTLPRDFKLLWMTARYSLFPAGFDRERVVHSLNV